MAEKQQKKVRNDEVIQRILSETFKGKTVSLADIHELITSNLRGLVLAGRITYDTASELFSFKDDFSLYFGKNPRDTSDTSDRVKVSSPDNYLDMLIQTKTLKEQELSGKPYSNYSIAVSDVFSLSSITMPTHHIHAAGCFLWAYHQATGTEYELPRKKTSQLFFNKCIDEHLSQYTLAHLEHLYPYCIHQHIQNNLTISSPKSITYALMSAYHELKNEAELSSRRKRNIDVSGGQLKTNNNEQQAILLKARSAYRDVKNCIHMWHGLVFDTTEEKQTAIASFPVWSAIDREAENEIIDKASSGKLVLPLPLPMRTLKDLFFIRTVEEDKQLFMAYVFTQRAKLGSICFLRENKKLPLGYGVEDLELPEFYKRGKDAYI